MNQTIESNIQFSFILMLDLRSDNATESVSFWFFGDLNIWFLCLSCKVFIYSFIYLYIYSNSWIGDCNVNYMIQSNVQFDFIGRTSDYLESQCV